MLKVSRETIIKATDVLCDETGFKIPVELEIWCGNLKSISLLPRDRPSYLFIPDGIEGWSLIKALSKWIETVHEEVDVGR